MPYKYLSTIVTLGALKMQKMLELHVPIYSDGSVAYIDVFEQLALRACGFSDVSEVMTANR